MRRKPAKRNVLGSLTDRELKIIELRTSGLRPGVIAKLTGVSRQAIYHVIHRIYIKAGLNNMMANRTVLLTRWAYWHGLDEPLRADLPEEIPEPIVKRRRTKARGRRSWLPTLRMKRSRPRVPR
ncbi:MAG: hypothetical protein ABSB35_03120 [Bryobacteraceae bacterium]